MSILAVAWDVDGTLVDSEPLHHEALLRNCADFGLDLRAVPENRFIGVAITDVWTALRPDLPADLGRDVWIAGINWHYMNGLERLVAMPGAREAVEFVASRGIRQCCASNSHRAIVEANIGAFAEFRHIEFAICLDDVANGKPDPEIYRAACHKMNIDPHHVLAAEDSNTGLLSALHAGLHAVRIGTTPPLVEGFDYHITETLLDMDLLQQLLL